MEVQNGYKIYKGNNSPTLNSLNLVVPQGCVYALLGSSGCGKTTLLSCILGLKKLNEGSIHLLGRNVLRPTQSPVSVGYMPQEVSLYLEFSIGETLVYFGTLFGARNIPSKIKNLVETLQLPRLSSRVGNLSGGEERRVSLAVALIHDPVLLILDEPTAKIDPLIRLKIWEYLKSLTETKQVTVLLTTHYVDEARRGDIFGVMRGGRIIMEERPASRGDMTNSSLDQVILQHCKDMDRGLLCVTPAASSRDNLLVPPEAAIQSESESEMTEGPAVPFGPMSRVWALMGKNKTLMARRVHVYAFVVVMPAVVMLSTCIAVHNEPRHLALGVINGELPDIRGNGACLNQSLSCEFLEELTTSHAVHLVYFDTFEKGKNAVQRGLCWGVVTFPPNFSAALMERAGMGAWDDVTWTLSTISVRLDQTNTVISATLTSALYQALARLYQRILIERGLLNHTVAMSLNYRNPPLVGSSALKYEDYLC